MYGVTPRNHLSTDGCHGYPVEAKGKHDSPRQGESAQQSWSQKNTDGCFCLCKCLDLELNFFNTNYFKLVHTVRHYRMGKVTRQPAWNSNRGLVSKRSPV